MRIAVIFSGLLRNFEHTSIFFKKFLDDSESLKNSFEELTFDYFFYGYSNKSGVENCNKNLIKLINPRDFKIIEWNEELQILIENDAGGLSDLDRERVGSTSAINCLSSHRCKYESNLLRKNWAKINKISHDIVIYARIDSFFFREVLKEEIESAIQKDNLLTPPDWDFKCIHRDAVCDMFAMGNEDTMNRYFDSYKNIPSLVREKGYFFHPETLQGAHINSCNINRIECNRHFAFEYPYSKADIFRLWKDSYSKEQIESQLSVTLDEIPDNYRYQT